MYLTFTSLLEVVILYGHQRFFLIEWSVYERDSTCCEEEYHIILENKSDLHNIFAMNDVHESSFIHHSRFKSKWNHGVCIITVLKY